MITDKLAIWTSRITSKWVTKDSSSDGSDVEEDLLEVVFNKALQHGEQCQKKIGAKQTYCSPSDRAAPSFCVNNR